MWGWLRRPIDRGAAKCLPRFSAILDDVVREQLAKPEYKWFWFVKHMQARLIEADNALDGKRAWEIALTAYKEFLRSEKCEFGDPQYAWDRSGARELIEAMEIDYWEASA